MIPDRSWTDPALGAVLHTGADAVEWAQRFRGGLLATDIETPGMNTFAINCITMAWTEDGRIHSILLDPRVEGRAAADMYRRADRLVLHNCFEGSTEVMTRDGVRRFEDMAGETIEVWSRSM